MEEVLCEMLVGDSQSELLQLELCFDEVKSLQFTDLTFCVCISRQLS